MKKFTTFLSVTLLAFVALAQQSENQQIEYKNHENGQVSCVIVTSDEYCSIEVWDNKGNKSYQLNYHSNRYVKLEDVYFHSSGAVEAVTLITIDVERFEECETILTFDKNGKHLESYSSQTSLQTS